MTDEADTRYQENRHDKRKTTRDQMERHRVLDRIFRTAIRLPAR